DYVDPLARMLHGVSRVSGPNVVETFRRDDVHAYLVEFVVAANSPFVYSLPRVIDTPPVVPETVQDVVRNLVPYPSAELPGDPVRGRGGGDGRHRPGRAGGDQQRVRLGAVLHDRGFR